MQASQNLAGLITDKRLHGPDGQDLVGLVTDEGLYGPDGLLSSGVAQYGLEVAEGGRSHQPLQSSLDMSSILFGKSKK